jgi:flavodoxin
VKSFLSDYDLAGKSVAPFCTHEGSGLGHSVADISKLCPESQVLEGCAVSGEDQQKVIKWLRTIGIVN